MDKKLFNRVLVLDDDPASLYLARLTLQEMNIAEDIACFQYAKQVLDFIKVSCLGEHAASEDCPDLILLDINLPGMDGFDFLQALDILGKKHLIHKVVVVLTSSENPKDQLQMRALGVRGLISKSITEEKLMGLLSKSA